METDNFLKLTSCSWVNGNDASQIKKNNIKIWILRKLPPKFWAPKLDKLATPENKLMK
jgi:hypothetical protein